MATTSYHLRSTSELMLVATIKSGFVEYDERLISYSTRLGLLLDVLFQGRRAATEIKLLPGSGPIERLDTIFSTQWAIRQRPQRAELCVSAVFDSSWEAYLRNLQQNTGELLDAIFCHCDGYDGHTCMVDGYERFSRWLRDRQVQTRFFHAATPDLTISDLRGMRRIVSGEHDTRTAIGSVEQAEALMRSAWPPPDEPARKLQAIEREQALNAMLGLAETFSNDVSVSGRSERVTYDAAIRSLLSSSLDRSLQRAAIAKGLLPDPTKKPPPAAAPVAAAARAVAPLGVPRPEQLQYNILRAYNDGLSWDEKTKHGLVVMLQADGAEAAKALLGKVTRVIATDAWGDARQDRLQVNVALTHAGLARLGLGEEVLEKMPPEFRAGMESRAGLLGDVGAQAHPSSWEQVTRNWPDDSPEVVSLSNVDVVLVMQRAVPPKDNDHRFDRHHPLYPDLEALELEGNGVHILHVQALRRYSEDHFRLGEESQSGSQPRPPWPPAPAGAEPAPSCHDVPLGEILLGHRDRHGKVAEWAKDNWLFENGTFLVVRKLRQDVSGFESYLQHNARELGVGPSLVKAWALGRDPSDGRTLVAPGAPDPGDEFDYSGREAAFCPLHAHVRRANPRIAGTPRILRRSFPYGSRYEEATAADDRGLVFMAYNASIAEQFEVIQRWLNGGNATGLPSIVNDLIAGVPQVAGADRWAPGSGHKKLAPPQRPFISLRWGLYLFVPSVPALQRLAELPEASARSSTRAAAKRSKPKRESHASVARKVKRTVSPSSDLPRAPAERRGEGPLDDRGRRIISEILDIEAVERQKLAWKEVLEEQPDRLADAARVWAAIRHPELLPRLREDFPRHPALEGAPAGTLPTAYGLLVSRYDQARDIFADDGTFFSVAEYGVRLRETIEGHYLGIDGKDPGYGKRACVANAYLAGLEPGAFYEAAREGTVGMLERVEAAGELNTIDLRTLAAHAIGRVAQKLLIDPDPKRPEAALLVKPFIPISRYCFQPHPDDRLKEQAAGAGKFLCSREMKTDGPLSRHLRSKGGAYKDEKLVRSAVIGAMVGFAPPAVAHVVGILRGWLSSGELQRHSRKSPGDKLASVIQAMTRVPVPPTLYRAMGSGAHLGGQALPIDPSGGSYVIIGTQSVTRDALWQAGAAGAADAWQWLFAGERSTPPGQEHDAQRPAVHGCPARHHAVMAISGAVDALCGSFPDARLCGGFALLPGPRKR